MGGISGCRIDRDVILATTDGGQDWANQGDDTEVPTLSAVACPSATTCYAVGGDVILTTTDGTTWNEAL